MWKHMSGYNRSRTLVFTTNNVNYFYKSDSADQNNPLISLCTRDRFYKYYFVKTFYNFLKELVCLRNEV